MIYAEKYNVPKYKFYNILDNTVVAVYREKSTYSFL